MVCYKNLWVVLAFTSILSVANASITAWDKYTTNEMAYDACQGLIMKTAKFCKKADITCFCSNHVALGTFSHCYVDDFFNSSTKINYFLDYCKSGANVTLTAEKFYAAYDNATKYLIDPTTTKINATAISYSPVSLKKSTVERYMLAYSRRWMNYNRGIYFGTAMIAYWFLIMFVAAIGNWSVFLFPKLTKILSDPVSKAFRRYISLPATGRRSHATPKKFLFFFEWIVPTRLETIIVFIWFVMVVLMESIGYNHTVKNPIWASKEGEMSRLVADRTGISSLFMIPLLILFAGRNNFMQWVTGWSYSRMIMFHRWTSRITFAVIFVHAVAMTASGYALGKLKGREAQPYYRWGIVATVCGGIMMFQGLLFFRKRWYEVFVGIHILMAVFFVAGGWIHTKDQGFQAWYYAAVAVWCFDRFVRIVRLVLFGAPKATVELKADETLRITVPRPAYWKPFPGCHAFIHFLRPSCFWQSHPFTIVDSVDSEKTITFYCKVKGGITHGLYQYLMSQPNSTAEIRVSVEGPYGNRLPIEKFSNTVFLTGGNGIPGLYSEAYNLATRKVDQQRVRFYWVIRHWRSIDWFHTELKKFEGTIVEPIIYVTKPESNMGKVVHELSSGSSTDEGEFGNEGKDSQINEKTHESLVEELKNSLPHIEFREGRPDINEIVKQEITEANGSIAFVSCAHGDMVDDARRSVVSNLNATKHNVEYYEQIQVW